MMKRTTDYDKTMTGEEWENCAQALTLQAAKCNDEIKKHEKAIEELKSTIKAYDTCRYKIIGTYLYIKPDCYKEEEEVEK